MTEREIFLEALDIPTANARAAFLQGACGRDVILREKVEELLKEHFSDDSLLVGPAVDGARPGVAAPSPREVQVIGRYRLLEKIGEGGCGVVYVAEQMDPVRRRVAVKVIKLGMDTKSVVARFEAERQALALMDHPNIAKVLDAGSTETGRPYFVMELVRGKKITEYCDEAKLSTQARLNLFVRVCQAIQHAHQKGIIHRDIKPSNVLVTVNDGEAVPKVIDFGIAKATSGQQLTDKTIYTAFEQFIGTPAYMSPEQAVLTTLDVDTRSDIYALGVLLYELLTGQTPFDAKQLLATGLDEMRRTIREREPPFPSSRLGTLNNEDLTTTAQCRGIDALKLVSDLRGDLDWIVMKCLEKDRARRYETANGLAADIRRHINNEPVVACPPAASYRLMKFVRRNKRTVAVGAFILITLAVGIIGTLLGQRKELAHRNRANERARQAIEMVLSDAAIEQLMREKGLREDQTNFLGKMIEYYAESVGEAVSTEAERLRQARAYYRMGRLNQILSRPQESEIAYRRAVALGERLVADFPKRPELILELFSSRNGLGLLLSSNGQRQEAELVLLEASATMKQLAADFPARPEFRQALAGIRHNIGNLLHVTGRFKEAEAAHAEALIIRNELATKSPHEPILRRALAMSHNSLGWLYQDTKRFEKAEPEFRDAVSLQRQVVADLPNQPEFRLELAKSLYNFGNLLRETERPNEGDALQAEAIVIFKQLVADYPNRPEFRQELAERGLTPEPH